MQQAKRHLQVMERRWERKKKTYFDSGKYSTYDVQSKVHRIEMRLFEADKELACARAVYWQRRGKWLRERSLDVLGKRLDENPEDLDMLILWQTQATRILQEPPMPHWTSIWPGLGSNIYDGIVRHYGMSVTWGMTHADELKATDARWRYC